MLLISNLKAILLFCIYFGLLYIILYNYSTSSNSYNKRSNNFSNMQDLQNTEFFNNRMLIDNKYNVKNFEEDDIYNVNHPGFKHNIDCDTNPSILIAPYCYKFQSNDIYIDVHSAELNISYEFEKLKPKRKHIDSQYRTKFIGNVGKSYWQI